LAPNQCGKDGNGIETYGHSLAVGPQGNILGTLDKYEEDILIVNLNFNKIPKSAIPVA
jgi:predicted amidohydrolase